MNGNNENSNFYVEIDDDLPPPPPEDEDEPFDMNIQYNNVNTPFQNQTNDNNINIETTQPFSLNSPSPFDDISSPFDDLNQQKSIENITEDDDNNNDVLMKERSKSTPPKRPPPKTPAKKSRIHFSSLFVPYEPESSKINNNNTNNNISNEENQPSNNNSAQQHQRQNSNDHAPVILNTVKQLIHNETEYQQNIEIALKYYYEPFKNFISKSKKSIISDFDQNMIMLLFSNLGIIHNFHSQFISRLNLSVDGKESLGDVIKSTAPMFKVYTDYLIHVNGILDTVKRLRKNKEFSKFLEECKSKSGSTKDLEDFINLPVDDLTKYEGYIKSIINRILQDHPDYNSFKEAITHLNKVSEHIVESKLAHENRIKIISIQSKVTGIPNGLILVAPHRKFLKEGNLQMKHSASKGGKVHNVTAYAMNDMILITKEKGLMSKQEVCKHIISYHDANLAQVNGDRFGLLIETPNNNSYTFYFNDESVMNEWIELLKNAFKVLKNSRATSLVESSDLDLETKLQVEILSARNVVPLIYDPPDLYVQLSIGNQVKKTQTRQKCKFNPSWDETHLFNVRNPYNDTLNVEIIDARGNNVITSVNIKLDEMYDYVEKKAWFKLNKIQQNTLEELNPSIFMGLTIGPVFKN